MRVTLRKLVFGVVALASQSLLATGGIGSTGGGHAVVCHSPSGQIATVELLDLFEARQKGLQVRNASGDIYRDYAIHLMHLRATASDLRPVTDANLDEMRDNIAAYFNFLPPGISLPDSGDTGSHAALPTNCGIEQLAIYHDRSQRIDVNRGLWDRLDSLNKSALYMHESIYFWFRSWSGEVTSQLARRVVGSLSTTTLPPASIAGIPTQGAMKCHAEKIAGEGESVFYVYPDPTDPLNSSIIHFETLVGRHAITPTLIRVGQRIERSMLQLRGVPNSTAYYSEVVSPMAAFSGIAPLVDGMFEGFGVGVNFEYRRPFSISLYSDNGQLLDQHLVGLCLPVSN